MDLYYNSIQKILEDEIISEIFLDSRILNFYNQVIYFVTV